MPKMTRDPYATERKAPFTNNEMVTMTQVSLMTLHLWRKGTPTKRALKASLKGAHVLYPVQATMKWLREYQIPMHVHPDDLDGEKPLRVAAVKKPGPKPKALKPSDHPMAHK